MFNSSSIEVGFWSAEVGFVNVFAASYADNLLEPYNSLEILIAQTVLRNSDTDGFARSRRRKMERIVPWRSSTEF